MDAKDRVILEQQRTIESLSKQIESLTRQVENLTEMILLMRNDKFGPSSEKVKHEDDHQISLFNEVEIEVDAKATEPIAKEVKGYTRVNGKTKRVEILKDFPTREVLCNLLEEE